MVQVNGKVLVISLAYNMYTVSYTHLDSFIIGGNAPICKQAGKVCVFSPCTLLAAIVLAEKAPIHNRQISLKKTLLHWELLPLKHN